MLKNITPKSKYIAYLVLCGQGDCSNPGIIGRKYYTYSFQRGAMQHDLRPHYQRDSYFPGIKGRKISTKKLLAIMMQDNCTIYK